MRISNILKVALSTALLSSCSLYKNYERPSDINTDGIYGDAQSGDKQSLGDPPSIKNPSLTTFAIWQSK